MPLIEMATGNGNEVAVVERNHERAQRAASEYDCLVVEADATSMETLLDAGADRADDVSLAETMFVLNM